jgi:hypothetical protein
MVIKRRWLVAYSLAQVLKISRNRRNLRGLNRMWVAASAHRGKRVERSLQPLDSRLIALPPLG